MKKVFLLSLLSALVVFSCESRKPRPDPDPTHDELSEYTTHSIYNKKDLTQEEKLVWENHHIIQIDATNYKDGSIKSYGKDTFKYDGNDELEHISITYPKEDPDDQRITITTNTYDTHHNVTRTTIERNGELDAYYDYEYTYDSVGNILTLKDSKCSNGEIGHYNYIATTTNNYDNLSRLLSSEKIMTYYDDKDYPEKETGKLKESTTYTYQGDYQQYVTYEKEIRNIFNTDVLVEKTSITNELDSHGCPIHHIDEYSEYDESGQEVSEHTKTETYAEFYDNGYEYSHQTYDLLSASDTTLTEDYTIYYNNNNFTQKAFEMTYKRSDSGETLEFTKNKYDSKNRLYASESQEISGGKIQKEHYHTYGYDE